MGKNLIDLAGLREFKKKQDQLYETKLSEVQSELTSEKSRSTREDGVLSGKLEEEIRRAKEAEAGLGGNISELSNKIPELGTKIDKEIDRSKAAERLNASNIAAEKTRATTVEGELSGKIETLTTTATGDIKALRESVGAEKTRAIAAENALTGNLAAEIRRAKAAEEEKQDTLVWDSVPTEGSGGSVTSGGIYNFLKDSNFTITEKPDQKKVSFKFTLGPWSLLSSEINLDHSHNFSELRDKPTTLGGYGIVDAKIESGTITLGTESIKPITDISLSVPKGLKVTNSGTGNLTLGYENGYEIPKSSKQSSWDEAAGKAHTHSNQADLDKISKGSIDSWNEASGKTHTHSNLVTLNAVSPEKVLSWNEAAVNSHNHTNKTALDSVTGEKISAWDRVVAWFNGAVGTDSDSIINKWSEIVRFLEGIPSSSKLGDLINSVNSSINSIREQKQDKLTWDEEPTVNSDNPVKSGGIYRILTENERTTSAAINDIRTATLNEVTRSKAEDSVISQKIDSEIARAKAAEEGKSPATHTHSIRINGTTKTISRTGGEVIDLGNYLTEHQSLAQYPTNSQVNSSITGKINELTVSEIGGESGKYISSISETAGKISATTKDLPNYGMTIDHSIADGVVKFKFTKDSTTILDKSVDFRHNHTFSSLVERPTTLGGYGIVDAKIESGTITLGTETIKPITDLSAYSTTSQVGSSITSAIGALSVNKVGGVAGDYISSISETAGKISATTGKLPEYTISFSPSSTNGVIDVTFKKDSTTIASEALDFTHRHDFSEIINKPTTLAGYGILDTYNRDDMVREFQVKIQRINHVGGDTLDYVLRPNTFNVWGTVADLRLTLGEDDVNMYCEYLFQFTCPDTQPTRLALPATIKWASSSTIEKGKTYQARIVNNIITMIGTNN